jgi:uncharacterized membrane protein YphA (DoxX/SURF4 family)
MYGELRPDRTGMAWASFFARVLLGLLFLMAGIQKVLIRGASAHADAAFVEPFIDTWIPGAVLYLLGLTLPFLELVAGLMLVIGFRTQEALITVGLVLLATTFGHLLLEPFYDISTRVFPHVVLMILVFLIPSEEDLISVDGWQRRKRLQLLGNLQEE